MADDDPVYANFASNRADLELSLERLRRYQPEAFGLRGLWWCLVKRQRVRWMLAECMKYGDARAGVVWSLEPLVFAAYSDVFDAVWILFSDVF